MNNNDKKELIRLLKIYKDHLWDDCNLESNNLPYELALINLEDSIDYLIRELTNELKEVR